MATSVCLMLGQVAASAHVSLTETRIPADTAMTLAFRAPLERDNATNARLETRVPTAFEVTGCHALTGWQCDVTPGSDGTVVVWDAITVGGTNDIRFEFDVVSPSRAGTYRFPTIQTYSDGHEAAWIADGEPNPAPFIEVVAASDPAPSPEPTAGATPSPTAAPAPSPSTGSAPPPGAGQGSPGSATPTSEAITPVVPPDSSASPEATPGVGGPDATSPTVAPSAPDSSASVGTSSTDSGTGGGGSPPLLWLAMGAVVAGVAAAIWRRQRGA